MTHQQVVRCARRHWLLRSSLLIGCVALPSPPAAVAQLALGPEFQVNTYTLSFQTNPGVAAGTSGAFVVVWDSRDQDGDVAGIYGQRYANDGTPDGPEFPINSVTAGAQLFPSVAIASTNVFAAWTTGEGSSADIAGRLFADDGTPLGPEFPVNSTTAGGQDQSAMAADPSGNVLIAWVDFASGQIRGQRFDSAGTPLGAEMQISTGIMQASQSVTVAADGLGNFVVAWIYGSYEVQLQRFDSAGMPLGTQGTVSYDDPDVADSVSAPSVAADGSGNFAVVWLRLVETDATDRYDVRGRWYDSMGQPRGPEFTIVGQPNDFDLPYAPVVTATSAGDFTVLWGACSLDPQCFSAFLGRRVSLTGTPFGDVFEVTHSTMNLQRPRAAARADGFVVAWQAESNSTPDADIFARLFVTRETTPVCTAGTIITGAQIKLGKLGAPLGDEKMAIKGSLLFPLGTPATLDPSLKGAQILIEDLGSGNTATFDLSTRTEPIASGAGCAANDGWKVNGTHSKFTYKNKSGELPPGCTAGSANGLHLLKLQDLRARGEGIRFKLKVKNASFAAPVGPLRVTLVLGASAADSAAGECGVVSFSAGHCTTAGSTLTCE